MKKIITILMASILWAGFPAFAINFEHADLEYTNQEKSNQNLVQRARAFCESVGEYDEIEGNLYFPEAIVTGTGNVVVCTINGVTYLITESLGLVTKGVKGITYVVAESVRFVFHALSTVIKTIRDAGLEGDPDLEYDGQ